MSNGREVNVYERLWKLWTMVCKMVMDGTRDADKVVEVLQGIVDSAKIYLMRLYPMQKIMVGATKGTKTLVSSGVFNGGVYGLTLPASGKPTSAVEVWVNELTEDGTFADIFGSLGKNRLKWQNQEQVADFCRNHRDKLQTDGYGTFFELEGGFVVSVRFDGGGRLRACVLPFVGDYVWIARFWPRFVLPQPQQVSFVLRSEE